MPRKLTSAQARAAFDELTREMPKQHLRLPFRKRFGRGEGLEATIFKRGTAVVDRSRPVTNLLQEVPARLVYTRLVGTTDGPSGEELEVEDPNVTIGELFSPEVLEEGLIVQGRRARIYVYGSAAEDNVYVFRVVTEIFGEEVKAPVKPSRKVRTGVKPPPRSKRMNRTTRGRH